MSAVQVQSETAATDALARGLLSVDASRRVGWAKAFDGARRIDDLETQVGSLQSELDSLRTYYARLVAFVQGLGITDEFGVEEVTKHVIATASFMNAHSWRAGMLAAGQDELAEHPPRPAPPRLWKETFLPGAREELRSEAEALGHVDEISSYPDTSWFWVCSCGEKMLQLTEKEAHQRRWQHKAQVVHGMSYGDWRLALKRRFGERGAT